MVGLLTFILWMSRRTKTILSYTWPSLNSSCQMYSRNSRTSVLQAACKIDATHPSATLAARLCTCGLDPASKKLLLLQPRRSNFVYEKKKINVFADVGCFANRQKRALGSSFVHMSSSLEQGVHHRISAQNSLALSRSLMGEKDGVVIVDHGSRRAQSNDMLREFVEIYKEKTGHPIVEPAHMELADPTIEAAFDLCVIQGATRVIISPYFLFPGRHWERDIPALVAAAAKKHPGVPYIVTAPIGLHELMVKVIQDRMNHCLSKVAGDAAQCEMCVGTGLCQQKPQYAQFVQGGCT
ncbi:hypothetical protein O6H91_12G027400 [Diphasiastrum complanatum]|uniref:Uncharacterized protein n=1 Tax=Diphasiastrum complanatum TaxID=34168 RepID=A0ACC2C0J1_DIPCM|nr:hypothetical protein O6H91_12G027400 [Diphasiastrum complanatum]